jgi:hypothetical protein
MRNVWRWHDFSYSAIVSIRCAFETSSGEWCVAEIQQHVLRVGCRRCGRTIEIQKADAVRLAGVQAVWKDVGQRLLDDTCQQRTGRHEEDGCWPSFE